MNILLVDDESFVLDYLEDCIHELDLDIDFIYRADCVEDAYDLLTENDIPLLITDIRMPEKSGFDLLHLIQSDNLSPKIILLSGYSEFEFAQTAIHYGVEEYLLKPVMPEELQRVLESAIDNVTNENRKRSHTRIHYQQSLSVMREQLLLELLQGKAFSEKDLQTKLSELLIDIPYSSECIIGSIQIRDHSNVDRNEIDFYTKAFVNITEEILFDGILSEKKLWYCTDHYQFFHFIIPSSQIGSINEKLVSVKRTITDLLKVPVVIFQSEVFHLHTDFHSKYMQIINYSLRLTEQHEDKIHLMKNFDHAKTPIYFHHLNEVPSMLHLMEASRWNEALEKVETILATMEKEDNYSQQHLIEMMYYLFSCFSYISAKNNMELADISEGLLFIQNPFSIQTPQNIKQWVKKCIDHLSKAESGSKSNKNFLISQIHTFISENMHKDVTLGNIAEHVYLHPVYLSRMYKKETGVSLSSYIFQLRMQKAVTLLLTSNRKIADISLEVGYQKTQYFIRLFKEHYKMTPQKYREAHYKN
ncbi:response regulator [Gracilibacillus oryzae]|uniref:Response regulator n=1 Tax=Gracilibacillus oryzae TaxID=1672701 RepID=A0A7C8KP33_9BACI|nr:response regulator [Gracilibacillus oryzae]KAB8125673.1 response regulator [Gracilibacillus oryzae]